MIDNANFLFEVGTEEIPAGYLLPAIEYLKKEFTVKLQENRIGFKEVEAYATPRRLAVLISAMSSSQSEEEVEIKGPSLKAAYDADEKPSRALQGFLKGNDISPADVYNKMTEKGEYIHAKKKMKACDTREIIPGVLENIIKNMPFPKRMRWSDKKLSFPRPVAYFLVLLDDKIVPFEMSGIASSNKTRGHYIRFNRMIEIKKIAQYEKLLKENGVIIDHNERKKLIESGLADAAKAMDGEIVFDRDVLETVTFLTESPFVVKCDFNNDFLKIPDIVLITEMKEHQKYFAIKNKNGNLLPNFLAVSNNPPTPFIKAGNERVITARFNDARFFFNEDRKIGLAGKVESLKSVLFHKELGTIYDKVERMRFVSDYLAGALNCDAAARKKIDRAVILCKADLNTAMVFEFTSLQGKIGRIYAMLDGEDADVADAIDDHYKPRFQGDVLPGNLVSIVASLSEKIDNIFSSYSVGNIPKGSQDPYALRRQANAIVEMLISSEISIDMEALLKSIAKKYKKGDEYVSKILEFISARANTIFTENGFRYDEIDACLYINYYNYLELFRRAKSLHEFRKNEGFSEMLLSFKRMNNIVTAFTQKNPDYKLQFNSGLLKEDTEKELYRFFDSRKDKLHAYIKSNEYTPLFKLLIEGKTIIDKFFDSVMVMVTETELRDSRLALLEMILSPFKNMINFSKISE